MLSFTDLPPEVRKAIYKIQLQSTLKKTTRVLYGGQNPLRCGDTPHCIRHNQPFKRNIPTGQIRFLDARIIYARDIYGAKYRIHHADLDDLLRLASTCRLVRSDLLALIWSRADIQVASPELYTELHCIFYDRLTSESRNFIRTLEIDIHDADLVPSETRKIVGLIRRRLPNIERLTVNKLTDNVFEAFGPRGVAVAPSFAAFRILPPSVVINFTRRKVEWVRARGGTSTDNRNPRRKIVPLEPKGVDLESLRAELSLIGQRRKEE
jgi:hypothetical protein